MGIYRQHFEKSEILREELQMIDFDYFIEELKAAPGFVKENVMCYYYHNTSACRDCPKYGSCPSSEPRDIVAVDGSADLPPVKLNEYLVRVNDYSCIAVPNPDCLYRQFCDLIRRLGRGEYQKLFNGNPRKLTKEEILKTTWSNR